MGARHWYALDWVKAICVLVMVWIHVTFWISGNLEVIDQTNVIFQFAKAVPWLGFFPLSIPLTAGCSFWFLYQKLRELSLKQQVYKVGQLSVLFWLMGVILNAVTWGRHALFDWDVLGFIGLSFLLMLAMLSFVRVTGLLILSVLILFLSGPLSIYTQESQNYFVWVLFGHKGGNTYWPLFPWFSIVALGFMISELRSRIKLISNYRISLGAIGFLSLLVAISQSSSLPILDPHQIWGTSLFQAHWSLILGLIGVNCLLFLVFDFPPFQKIPRFMKSLGHGILWIYLIHIPVGYHLSIEIKKWDSPRVGFLVLYFILIALSVLIGTAAQVLSSKKIEVRMVRRKATQP